MGDSLLYTDHFWLLSVHDRVTLNFKNDESIREEVKMITSCRSNKTERN